MKRNSKEPKNKIDPKQTKLSSFVQKQTNVSNSTPSNESEILRNDNSNGWFLHYIGG